MTRGFVWKRLSSRETLMQRQPYRRRVWPVIGLLAYRLSEPSHRADFIDSEFSFP